MLALWKRLMPRARYSVQRSADSRWEVHLHDQPEYCRALPMAPNEMEPELKEALWLVLVAAIWSGPDQIAIGQALSAVQEFGGEVKLGIRLFNEDAETRTWFPELPKDAASPVWLLFREGQLQVMRIGGQSQKDLRDLLRQAIDPTARDA